MGDKSTIEWTDSKACAHCGQVKCREDFAQDSSRADGLTYWCKSCRNTRARVTYAPRPRPARGRRYVPPRDNDRKQARRRVNYLVDAGLLPDPDTLPCVDCGHVGDDRRHEYDHHLGYDAAHHEDVEVRCSPCHRRREASISG